MILTELARSDTPGHHYIEVKATDEEMRALGALLFAPICVYAASAPAPPPPPPPPPVLRDVAPVPPELNRTALRELIEALEEHAAGRPLPRGMDAQDLVELAKSVEKRP